MNLSENAACAAASLPTEGLVAASVCSTADALRISGSMRQAAGETDPVMWFGLGCTSLAWHC